PVTFEDIAVHFSRQEWASLDVGQRQLYHAVMEDNYATLVSLYCALSKPQLIARMERGEEPCVPENPDPGRADLSLQLAAGPVATENCSEREWAPEQLVPGVLGCVSPSTTIAPLALAGHVPPSATAVPADPSQPTPSPSCPLSTCSREAVNLNQSVSPPPAAAGTRTG
ncbi:ZN783 protein, partial [Alcedo cyanopectus]|nr:ZN783 protein [Ceyx cyanopectus]